MRNVSMEAAPVLSMARKSDCIGWQQHVVGDANLATPNSRNGASAMVELVAVQHMLVAPRNSSWLMHGTDNH